MSRGRSHSGELSSQQIAQLAALDRPAPVSCAQMISFLAASREVSRWMLPQYVARDPVFEGHADALARLCIVREFGRRPRRVNSLETMGLAQVAYPQLASVREDVWAWGRRISAGDWRDFLKICLDFFVRANTMIDRSDQDRRWSGARVPALRLLPPESGEPAGGRQRRWPRALSPQGLGRVARLLAAGLDLDVELDDERDIVDQFLIKAWEAIHGCGLLRSDGPAYYLPVERLAFQRVERAWICPVTRRFLDTTFRGLTPYLVGTGIPRELATCTPVEIPGCEALRSPWPTERARLLAIRQWLREEAGITRLRTEGLWPDLNDRVLEGAGYLRRGDPRGLAELPGQDEPALRARRPPARWPSVLIRPPSGTPQWPGRCPATMPCPGLRGALGVPLGGFLITCLARIRDVQEGFGETGRGAVPLAGWPLASLIGGMGAPPTPRVGALIASASSA